MDKKQIIEDYLQGKHPIEQESWELPTAQELEKDKALFDSLMAERKAPSSLTPRPLQGERELKRRVFPLSGRGVGGGLIAACVAGFIVIFLAPPRMAEDQPPLALEEPTVESQESRVKSQGSKVKSQGSRAKSPQSTLEGQRLKTKGQRPKDKNL